MSVQSVALASLTATYTDSEGEDVLDDDKHHHHHNHHPALAQRRRASSETPGRLDDAQADDDDADAPPLASHAQARSSSSSPEAFVRTSETSNNHRHHHHHHHPRPDDESSYRNKNLRKRSRIVPTLVTDVTSKVQRLVSYFDDTCVSDDETGNTHDERTRALSSANGLTGSDEDEDEEDEEFSRKKNPGHASKREGELIFDETTEPTIHSSEKDERNAELTWGVTIPPEPPGHCTTELQEKIANLYRKMEDGGLDMNHHIQQRKEFRNPSIYEKLIQFCSINEMGTNYPPERFDPFKWGKDSYYEELARIQKNEMDKLEKARKEKTKIEIVTGTAKRPNSNSNANNDDEAKRRKSKWDQVATGTSTNVKTNVLVAQPTLATLTSSATGTKATVISAFGSLPKKRL